MLESRRIKSKQTFKIMVKKRNLAISELAGVLYKRTKYKGQPKSIRNG